MTTYRPRPLDTSAIALTPELAALSEKLAENVHDEWASQRLAQGWTWGPHRDDAAKRHPGLVPYAELPEEEKEVDRVVVMATLKGILALGFSIGR